MRKFLFVCLLVVTFILTMNIGNNLAQDGSLPDLKFTDLIVPTITAPGMKILITDVVRNIGTGDAGVSITRYFLKPQDSITYPGRPILLGRRYVSELDAGTANIGTTYLAMPSGAKLQERGWPVPGDYYIIAVTDSFNYIEEFIEKNNMIKRPIEFVYLPE